MNKACASLHDQPSAGALAEDLRRREPETSRRGSDDVLEVGCLHGLSAGWWRVTGERGQAEFGRTLQHNGKTFESGPTRKRGAAQIPQGGPWPHPWIVDVPGADGVEEAVANLATCDGAARGRLRGTGVEADSEHAGEPCQYATKARGPARTHHHVEMVGHEDQRKGTWECDAQVVPQPCCLLVNEQRTQAISRRCDEMLRDDHVGLVEPGRVALRFGPRTGPQFECGGRGSPFRSP
jgi:hypothetical protein